MVVACTMQVRAHTIRAHQTLRKRSYLLSMVGECIRNPASSFIHPRRWLGFVISGFSSLCVVFIGQTTESGVPHNHSATRCGTAEYNLPGRFLTPIQDAYWVTQPRTGFSHQFLAEYLSLFFFLSSGGWGKMKL